MYIIPDSLKTEIGSVSEDAGISPEEVFDVTPYALALTNTLIAEPDSWSLPRKYKIAFAGNDSDNANATFNDFGLIATTHSGEKGFRVYLGGGLGSKPTAGFKLSDFIPVFDLLYVGEAIKILFSEHGNRRNRHKARIRFDFREVAFPMNFVKTKIELASMKSGELLEILLDDGAPIKNVPGSVRNEGHLVLEEKKNDNFWSVLIRKQ